MTKTEWKALYRLMRVIHKTDIMTESGIAARFAIVDEFRARTGQWELPLWGRFPLGNCNHPRILQGEDGYYRTKGIWATNTFEKFMRSN